MPATTFSVRLGELESLEEPVEAHVLVGGSEDNFIVLLPLFEIVQEPRQRAKAGNFPKSTKVSTLLSNR